MEKNNYNINFNLKKLSSAEIAKHQDFDALLELYQTPTKPSTSPKPGRWLIYAGGAIAAALIGAVFFFGLNPTRQDGPLVNNKAEAFFASQPYLNPPFQNISAKFASFHMDAAEGGIYEYENGSRLIVPKAAFVDDRGSLIQGEIEIKYREFHDFIDFFVAGIPMEYDSAGTKYQLESAGMMEIYAEQDGQRIQINPEKTIDIELVSNINLAKEEGTPSYNIYQLDVDNRNWVYRGLDQIELIETMGDANFSGAKELTPEQILKQEIQQLELKKQEELLAIEASLPKPVKPIKPKQAIEEAVSFEFDFSAVNSNSALNLNKPEEKAINSTKNEMDALRTQWEGTIWQLKAGQESKLDESMAKTIWDEEKSKIKAINERDFELTLTNGTKTISLVVNPVLSPEDYEKALTVFNEQFAKFESKMTEREAILAEQKTALKERMAEERQMIDKEFEKRIEFYQSKGRNDRATDLMIRQKIVNRFKLSSFGIWNCDRPLPPYIFLLKGEFVDNNNNAINGQAAYLVNKTQNTLTRFFARNGADVRFDKRQENLMWLITRENKLALFEAEKFEDISDNTRSYTFVMDLQAKNIENEEDLRALLNFD